MLQTAQRPGQIARQAGLADLAHGSNGIAGGGRIGGIGLQQHGRALTAQQPTAEIGGNGQYKLHLATLQHGIGLRLGGVAGQQMKIAAIAHGADNGAAEAALFMRHHHCRQMFRIAVDGETEQRQLDQRNADHHRKRQPVAAELDEFLYYNRQQPAPVKAFRHGVLPLLAQNCRPTAASGG